MGLFNDLSFPLMTRFFKSFATISLVSILTLLPLATASAAILLAEDEVFFNEYVTEDVYIAGGNVTIQQDIDGDVFIAGGDITINSIITGDLFVAGGNVLVNGEVRDDVRMMGGAMTINSNVDGDLIIIGGSVDVNEDTTVGGDVIAISGKLNLYGTVNKSVQGILGRLVLAGKVNGNVDVRVTEKLVLLNSAIVEGDITYFSPEKIEDHGGTINGEVSFNAIVSNTERVKEGIASFFNEGYLIGKLWSFLSLLLIGSLMIAFLPNLLHRSSDRIKKEGLKCFGVGFLVFILGGTASAIAMFTVIGVQLAFIVMAMLFIFGEIGRVATGYWIGSLIIRDTSKKRKEAKRKTFTRHFLVLSVGLFLMKLITAIPVLGWVAGFVFFLVGVGALVMVERTTYHHLIKEKMV
jgi:hypothetical protein